MKGQSSCNYRVGRRTKFAVTDPTTPLKVWKDLAIQFHKTWANKLELKWNLFSMKLGEGGSAQDHIKSMTDVCDELLAISESCCLPPDESARELQCFSNCPRSQC